jgi:hypothetical protein
VADSIVAQASILWNSISAEKFADFINFL